VHQLQEFCISSIAVSACVHASRSNASLYIGSKHYALERLHYGG
jgi:hypothetical protein